MRAAVLCPGPSLLRGLFRRESYDVRLGVNRAVALVPCDYWVSQDAEAFDVCHALGYPILVMPADQWVLLADRPRRALYPVLYTQQLQASAPVGLSVWWTWSSLAAIVAALHLGAKTVDCYGMDLEGREYFDGEIANSYPACNRWERERNALAEIQAAVALTGRTVRRVTQ